MCIIKDWLKSCPLHHLRLQTRLKWKTGCYILQRHFDIQSSATFRWPYQRPPPLSAGFPRSSITVWWTRTNRSSGKCSESSLGHFCFLPFSFWGRERLWFIAITRWHHKINVLLFCYYDDFAARLLTFIYYHQSWYTFLLLLHTKRTL